MKTLITISALFFATLSFGQTIPDTVTIASYKLSIPAACKVQGENKIHCDNYTVAWTYGDEQKVKGLQDAFLEMGAMLDKFKKKRLELYLFDTKVKGYKVSYKNTTGTTYQLSASGIVSGEPVWVLVDLDKDPNTNEDIPQFVRQIIRFSETKK